MTKYLLLFDIYGPVFVAIGPLAHWPIGIDRLENTVYCTPVVSVGTCLFAKALLSNGCIYLLIKNLLPSSRCRFVVCFKVVTQ
jgi:hypothetical protein